MSFHSIPTEKYTPQNIILPRDDWDYKHIYNEEMNQGLLHNPLHYEIPRVPNQHYEILMHLAHLKEMQDTNYDVLHPILNKIYQTIKLKGGISRLVSLLTNAYSRGEVYNLSEGELRRMKPNALMLPVVENNQELERNINYLRDIIQSIPALQPILNSWIDTMLKLVFTEQGFLSLTNFIENNTLPAFHSDPAFNEF